MTYVYTHEIITIIKIMKISIIRFSYDLLQSFPLLHRSTSCQPLTCFLFPCVSSHLYKILENTVIACILLSILRFICIVVCINSLSLFIAEYDFIVWTYHALFICSPLIGHLGCFHFGAITNKAARTFVNKSVCTYALFPFGI